MSFLFVFKILFSFQNPFVDLKNTLWNTLLSKYSHGGKHPACTKICSSKTVRWRVLFPEAFLPSTVTIDWTSFIMKLSINSISFCFDSKSLSPDLKLLDIFCFWFLRSLLLQVGNEKFLKCMLLSVHFGIAWNRLLIRILLKEVKIMGWQAKVHFLWLW